MQSDSDKASLDRRQRAPAHAEARLKERGARHVGTLESLLPEAGCNLPRLDIWQSSSGSSLWQVIPVHLCLSLNPRNYLFQATPTHMHHVTIQTRRTALLTESPWSLLLTVLPFWVISALPAWTSFTSSPPSVEAASAEAASGEASANSWGGS